MFSNFFTFLVFMDDRKELAACYMRELLLHWNALKYFSQRAITRLMFGESLEDVSFPGAGQRFTIVEVL